jgi:hypothetical protein
LQQRNNWHELAILFASPWEALKDETELVLETMKGKTTITLWYWLTTLGTLKIELTSFCRIWLLSGNACEIMKNDED